MVTYLVILSKGKRTPGTEERVEPWRERPREGPGI